LSRALTAVASVRRLAPGERPLSVVMYHSISRGEHRYSLDPATFRDQVLFLSDHYPIVRLGDARTRLASPSRERAVALTFDDAYEDFADHALPILEEIGVPASLFVPTGFIGKTNLWDSAQAELPQTPIMSAERIRQIARSALVEIGSHSVDHLSMRPLAAAEMKRQAVLSKIPLEELLGRPVTMFAYPYGTLSDFSAATARVLGDAGYQIGVTSHWGSTNSLRRLLGMKRIFFNRKDGTKELRGKVEGDYDWIALKEWGGYLLRQLGVKQG
jgi:peptidoglycan/xylan/chitin deacetylase (PgdA/CDA1 family)